jgi:hypothetical protein
MRLCFIAFVLFVGCIRGYTQTDFRPGYIIMANGDSIPGKVAYGKFRDPTPWFKSQGSRKAVSYTPEQVRAYGYINDKRFESTILPVDSTLTPDGPVFAEVLVSGYMSLMQRANVLYVMKPDGKIVKLPDQTPGKVKVNDAIYATLDRKFIGFLSRLFGDCTISIPQTIGYNETQIGKLVQAYNRCKGQPDINYKKMKKALLVTMQAFGGIQATTLTRAFDDKILPSSTSVVGGVGFDWSNPRAFDRFFLSVECLYTQQFFNYFELTALGSTTDYHDFYIKQTTLKIPVGLRYNFTNESHTLYLKAGIISGVMMNLDIQETRELYVAPIVRTTVSLRKISNKQNGVYGSVGFTKEIHSRLRVFMETRFESTRTDQDSGFHNRIFSVYTGIRF